MTNTGHLGIVLAFVTVASVARGQQADLDETEPSDSLPAWVEADPFSSDEHDPLGVDRGDQLESVSPTRPDEEAQRPIAVTSGEILTAIAGVRESDHAIEIRLEEGFALVEETMQFRSSARYAAELRYRLSVPEEAGLARLEVCNERGCREGRIDASSGPLNAYDDAVRSRTQPGVAPLPVADARVAQDARGRAIFVRAAPVEPARPAVRGANPEAGQLVLRITWLAAAPVRGGRARFRIPARGADIRASTTRVRVRSSELARASVDGEDAVESARLRPPSSAFEVSARMSGDEPPVDVSSRIVPCASGWCGRVRAVAAARPLPARRLIFLLDVSPSMAGPARGRTGPTTAALLSMLPSTSRVQVIAFAARARAIVPTALSPTEVPLVRVSRALEEELGSATRFSAAWEALETVIGDEGPRPVVVWIGDGGLTREDLGPTLGRVRRQIRELVVVNVADREVSDPLREIVTGVGGRVLSVGTQARRATSGHGVEPLQERLANIVAPVAQRTVRVRIARQMVDLGPLRAGEERVWEGALVGGRAPANTRSFPWSFGLRDWIERRAAIRTEPITLSALAPESLTAAVNECRLRGTFRSASAVVPARARLALAETRRCTSTGGGARAIADTRPARFRQQTTPARLPRRSLLDLLRNRLVPVARGCFRSDRRGRSNYERRAVFRLALADREVVDAEVDGRIDASLRSCLLRSVDGLEIPRFAGTARVTYPLFTEPQLPPPTLTLDTEVADTVDAVLPSEGDVPD